MTPQEALQVVEQARQLINLKGNEADILREAVIVLRDVIALQKEINAQVIPIDNGRPKD